VVKADRPGATAEDRSATASLCAGNTSSDAKPPKSPRHDALAAVGDVLDALDVPHRLASVSIKVRMQRGIIKPGQVLLESASGDIKQVRLHGVEHVSYAGIDPKTFDASVVWVSMSGLSAAKALQYQWSVQPMHYN
jgi:hypothetical protein